MRIIVALVALLYVIAAFYGYFWWGERQNSAAPTQAVDMAVTAPTKPAMEQSRFLDLKPDHHDELWVQQLQTLQASFESQLKQLELKQAIALKSLQQQLDDLKQQQAQSLIQTKPKPPVVSATNAVNPSFSDSLNPVEQIPEEPVKNARKILKAGMSQLDTQLHADTPDLGRESIFQQNLDEALNQAELASTIQGRTECGRAFCKLDIQGKAPEGVDVLQVLWEQHVFPESTEVLTIPKSDGSGWIVYVAEDGKSLPSLP